MYTATRGNPRRALYTIRTHREGDALQPSHGPRPPRPSREVSFRTRPLAWMTRAQAMVSVAVMASIFLASLNQTFVGTALPTVIGELGGLDRYGWVFASFLVTSTATGPLFGRFSDVVGRRPVFLAGIVIFLLGSLAGGFVRSFDELILARAVQGLGVGAIIPVGQTIIGDAFAVEQRARVQGIFSSVWGISAIIGPVAGGILTEAASWRWVFLANVPFGLLALLLARSIPSEPSGRRARLDWAGALLLLVSVVGLLFALDGLAVPWTWALAIGGGVVFVVVERRTAEPMLDLGLLRIRALRAGLATLIPAGVVMFGVLSYVPAYVQGVQGGGPIEAGAVLLPLSIGWPLASVLGARISVRRGYRPVLIAGGAALAAGSALVATLRPDTPLVVPLVGLFLVGFGLGCSTISSLLAAQSTVERARRGIATSLVNFIRSMGGAVGVGALGAVLTSSLGPLATEANDLLDPIGRRQIDPERVAVLAGPLAEGLERVFIALLVAGVAALIIPVALAPRGVTALDEVPSDPAQHGATAR
jgi:EmrB/QacA subfamily drug resistance transporter